MVDETRYLILDESGNLGIQGRYFVIACIDTKNKRTLHNIIKRKLLKAKTLFPELSRLHANEIKASEAYPCIKYHLLECISSKDLSVSYIVLDKKYADPKLMNDKNIMYNYLSKILISHVVRDTDKDSSIEILCDNHTVKTQSLNSFSDYIKLSLNYEAGYNLDLKIQLIDSDSNDGYVIQAADYVANAIYNAYEKNSHIFMGLIKEKIDITEKFPRGNFGK